MCLTPKHKNPFVAEEDILCKKRLCYAKNGDLITPYQHELIQFKNGVAVQTADHFGFDLDGDIHEGIHCYSFNCPINWHNIYPCIIPKGAQYFIGTNNYNLVSLKLIIFKNKFRYWIYKIFHKSFFIVFSTLKSAYNLKSRIK